MTDKNPEGYAVELYFDHQMEEAFFAFRNTLYQMGVEPVLSKLGDRPHISLAVFGFEDTQKLIRISEEFAKGKQSFPVHLEAIGAFPTSSNVLYLVPTPSIQLLQWHKEFHEALIKEKIHSSHYYLPDHWVPHCTLEFELPDEQFDLAARLCKKQFSPIHGNFNSLGVIAFRPIAYLAEFPFSKQEEK
jgi:2'-5' RNA ligase